VLGELLKSEEHLSHESGKMSSELKDTDSSAPQRSMGAPIDDPSSTPGLPKAT
jgi:hypothetical protein